MSQGANKEQGSQQEAQRVSNEPGSQQGATEAVMSQAAGTREPAMSQEPTRSKGASKEPREPAMSQGVRKMPGGQ